MLHHDHQARPSAIDLANRFEELLPLLDVPPDAFLLDFSYVDKKNILGTDVPQNHGVLRWEDILAPGDILQHMRMVKRCKRIVSARERRLGRSNKYTLWSMLRYAWLLFYLDRENNALTFFDEVVAAKQTENGPNHPETLSALQGFAWSCMNLGRNGESKHTFNIILKNQLPGSKDPDALSCQQGLALLESRAGDFHASTELFAKTAREQMDLLGRHCSDTLLTLSLMAWGYIHIGRIEEAALRFEEVILDQKKCLGLEHIDTMESLCGRAFAYLRLRQHEKAIMLYEEVMQIKSRVLGWHHTLTKRCMETLIRAYRATGKREEATRLRKVQRQAPNLWKILELE